MGTPFTSKINGNDIYAKRAEATRSGVNLETFTPKGGTEKKGILPAGLTPGNEGKDAANTLATQKYVLDRVGEVDAFSYKGVVTISAPLPTEGYKTGWTYKVAEAGTYAGHKCEVGDMLVANKNYQSGATASADWDAIEHNIDGAVSGPDSSTDEDLAVFDSTTGKVIKDSGVSLTALTAAMGNANSAYQKPSGGIPSTDLASAVQTSLGKADSSAQGIKIGAEGSTILPTDGIVTIPMASDEGPGMVSYETVDL